ncbi:hypothetical protein [Glycomyces sp. MUSA5-2]|uniref:hypothetical protein n=1 Tax=Glycomyces sp. MUSA5-2 TaxID=2053002 RepID=UPI00300A9C8E
MSDSPATGPRERLRALIDSGDRGASAMEYAGVTGVGALLVAAVYLLRDKVESLVDAVTGYLPF